MSANKFNKKVLWTMNQMRSAPLVKCIDKLKSSEWSAGSLQVRISGTGKMPATAGDWPHLEEGGKWQ